MPPRVKVCGLTSATDARQALQAGANALGFVFHPGSPRHLVPAAWPPLFEQLPAYSFCVAVFGQDPPAFIEEVLALGGFSACQVHGAAPSLPKTPAGVLLYRAFDPGQDEIEVAADFLAASAHHRLLLDPRRGGLVGGTGEGHETEALRTWLRRFPHAVLAGGLSPENIADMIARYAPEAIDASSSLERTPGVKDPDRVRAYITRAKGSP